MLVPDDPMLPLELPLEPLPVWAATHAQHASINNPVNNRFLISSSWLRYKSFAWESRCLGLVAPIFPRFPAALDCCSHRPLEETRARFSALVLNELRRGHTETESLKKCCGKPGMLQ